MGYASSGCLQMDVNQKKICYFICFVGLRKYQVLFTSYLAKGTCPQSHRRNLQTQGKSTLRFQPIAKKEELFLFFRLVHAHIVITELQGIIPYDSDYKIHDWYYNYFLKLMKYVTNFLHFTSIWSHPETAIFIPLFPLSQLFA
jgi:hypothetical protein